MPSPRPVRLTDRHDMYDHGTLVEVVTVDDGMVYATASKLVGAPGWMVEMAGNPYPTPVRTKRDAVRLLRRWVTGRLS
ncbi:hypothetical protein NDR87_18770 [Nocardia sp. CDC159]|uniref:Uncharacterized protein n=1 Tax=Nocardia pulmonis TaxID=2951408 RepID=A0A9X2EDV6_9NOCA|nr:MULTISPECIES: hypothetical protein [Nocardia]MCM6776266.1 hypothetical protein [Nocardia pulmonis]MCM6788408.1 hypothetical protein [Nocardia sp. CDC159]